MKKKAILTIIIILFIIALIGGYIYWSRLPKPEVEKITADDIQLLIDNFDISYVNIKKLPKNIKKYSQKYNLFNEIYTSDELVFVYGYEKWSLNKTASGKFHRDIQKRITENNLHEKYKVITITNPQKTVQQVARKNSLDPEKLTKGCKITNPNDEDIFNLTETTASCYSGACIINNKKNEYILLSKEFPEVTIKTMQEYK